MKIGRERLFGGMAGAAAVVAVAVPLFVWDSYARRSGYPRAVRLATMPLGDLANGDRDRARRAPAVVNVTPSETTGGAPQAAKKTPVEHPAAETHAPRSQDGTPSPRLDKPRETGVALAESGPNSAASNTAPRKEADPIATTAGIGMQAGAIVAHGRQAPELRLFLTSTEIVHLVASKRAVVTVENDDRALYFLDRPDEPFRPMSDLPVSTISNRYVAVTDPGLVSSWLVRLGQLPSTNYKFGLRFAKSFDGTIIERQFASLVDRGIDFEQTLARGARITTYGSFAEGLEIVINNVSVEESPRDPAQ
jgi:hypothetical protein